MNLTGQLSDTILAILLAFEPFDKRHAYLVALLENNVNNVQTSTLSREEFAGAIAEFANKSVLVAIRTNHLCPNFSKNILCSFFPQRYFYLTLCL